MIRALIGVLIAAIVAAFMRAVIAMISREVSDMTNPKAAAPQPPPSPSQAALRKCPVCGTYSPGDYCSDACRDKAK
jgi:hypothetical protein